MNKLVAGAIAGAAGIALLVGGSGTFALWNDGTTVSGGTISSGTLSIAQVGSPVWTDLSTNPVGGTTFTPATQKVVPGDTVQLKQRVTINTSGKNLKAELSYDAASLVTNATLLPFVTVTFGATPVAAVGSATVSAAVAPNTFTITPGAASSTDVDVTVTIAISSAVTGTVAQSLASGVNLSALGLTLTQVRP